jgi:glutamyl-tRNA reductase
VRDLRQYVKLYNIDDESLITERNKQERQRSVQGAYKILDRNFPLLETPLKRILCEIVSYLLSQVEDSRRRDLPKPSA